MSNISCSPIRLACVVLTAWTMPLALRPALAQQILVGSVQEVEPDGTRQAGDDTPAILNVSDKVFARDIVTTSAKGRVHVQFLDGTDLRLNPGSRVEIDEYVYDPNSGTGARGVVTMGRGLMRWVSGNVQPNGMKFKTQAATIGIRGTEILLGVGADGTTTLAVLSGVATLVPCGRGPGFEPYVAEKGVELIVDVDCKVSTSVASPTGAPASGPGATASATGPGGGPGGGPSGGPGNGNGNDGNAGNGGGNTGGSGPGTGNGGGNGNGNGNGGAGNGGK